MKTKTVSRKLETVSHKLNTASIFRQLSFNYRHHPFIIKHGMVDTSKYMEYMNLTELKVEELRVVLNDYGLPMAGCKKDLIKRVEDVLSLDTELGRAFYKKHHGGSIPQLRPQPMERRPRPKKAGFIYCVNNGPECKIGKTAYIDERALRRYLHRRYKTPMGFTKLDSSNLLFKYFDDVNQAERLIHERYADYRKGNSEVFTIDFNMVTLSPVAPSGWYHALKSTIRWFIRRWF